MGKRVQATHEYNPFAFCISETFLITLGNISGGDLLLNSFLLVEVKNLLLRRVVSVQMLCKLEARFSYLVVVCDIKIAP